MPRRGHRYCSGTREARARRQKQLTDAERFWTKVAPADANGCGLWMGAHNAQGYGVFSVGSRIDRSRRTLLAHRYAEELRNGPMTGELVAIHACDTPACVEHTRRGTQLENVRDMIAKGRNVWPPSVLAAYDRRREEIERQEWARQRYAEIEAEKQKARSA